MPTYDDDALGKKLVAEKLISEAQLRTALEYQETLGSPLKDIVVKLGFAKEAAIDRVMAGEVGMDMLEISEHEVHKDAMARLPRELVERHQVFPLVHVKGKDHILLAMSDPANYTAVEDVQFLTNCSVEAALSSRVAIKKALNQYYNEHGTPDSLGAEQQSALQSLPDGLLIRALIEQLLARGVVDLDDLLTRARTAQYQPQNVPRRRGT